MERNARDIAFYDTLRRGMMTSTSSLAFPSSTRSSVAVTVRRRGRAACASRRRSLAREATGTGTTGGSLDDQVVETSSSSASNAPSSSSFEPRVDVRATVSALLIGSAFFIVNRRVAAAVEKRKAREELEEERRRLKLERLRGGASMDDENDVEERLERAYAEEAEAREFGNFLGGVVRVRMPQPLGRPLTDVEAEERKVSAASKRLKELEEKAKSGDGYETDLDDRPIPWWMTSVSAVVVLLLTWSSIGLGSVDRVANAPPLTPEEIERFRR